MTISPIDELSAINKILLNIGEPPVSSLSGVDPEGDAGIAQLYLEDRALEVLQKGFGFNSVWKATWSQDGAGEVIIPLASIAAIVRIYSTDGFDAYRERGSKVYDWENRTTVLNKDVYADYLELLQFDELPQQARRYVQEAASMDMLAYRDGSSVALRAQTDREAELWDDLCQYDDTLGGYGFQNDNLAWRMTNRVDLGLR